MRGPQVDEERATSAYHLLLNEADALPVVL